MKKIIISYIPVVHDGYRKLLENHKDAEMLYLFGQTLTKEFEYLKKDIRALDQGLVKAALESWKLPMKVEILEEDMLSEVSKKAELIVMPDEDICHELKERYFKDNKVVFDSIFLRWDKHNSIAETPVTPDTIISSEKFDKEIMAEADKESNKSSDFWRHIGAAIVKEGEVISLVHNTHLPSAHAPYAHGDPRNAFTKGVNIDISTAIHAEARLIAEAAQQGVSLEGASMYVTTFPCPTCAKLIAFSGVKKLYALGGYAILDGEIILKAKGVQIIFVESDKGTEATKEWKGYTK